MFEEITKQDLSRRLGIGDSPFSKKDIADYVNLKLEALGSRGFQDDQESAVMGLAEPFLRSVKARTHLAESPLPPVDRRIQDFLDKLAAHVGEETAALPRETLILDRHGLARQLSIPGNADHFKSSVNDSYRVSQGVLHNPKSDRRTTAGVFHVADWGLPVPADKKAVPAVAALRLFRAAMNPPEEFMLVPLTAKQEEKAHCWVSLLLRPTVRPEVPGYSPKKSMEVRFFAPAVLSSNLDFVESIFGNAGDPFLPENDSALDVQGWSGQTGCVILAPHLGRLTKKELGLPNISEATERQKRDGMCWEKEDELYNDGSAFKITFRTTDGLIVTAISDSYFGYSKKEVKTQISFAANLSGQSEEEHAGGALVFPSYDLGEEFVPGSQIPQGKHTIAEVKERFSDSIDFKPEGYGVDKKYPEIFYVPEETRISLEEQTVTWPIDGKEQKLRLDPNCIYVFPSGYQVRMIKPAEGRRWRLRGTNPEATFCHKPCTVSGGGKSEISKSLEDAIISGPVFVSDFHHDFKIAKEVLDHDYSKRFLDTSRNRTNSRSILSNERSLGSVIKLLTPSKIDYTDEYNEWLQTIPQHVKDLVLIIKRFYKTDWADDWMDRFSVDVVDGQPGYELRYRNKKLVTQFLRVGYTEEGSWRTFGLRKDFLPAFKISREDDISASTVVPTQAVSGLSSEVTRESIKFTTNCEYRFFQRPDDAIIRGYDKQAEYDITRDDVFLSNYHPLTHEEVEEQINDTIRFEQYTKPVQDRLTSFHRSGSPDYCASSANPRIVDGKLTKNPRYLQIRPDIENEKGNYVALIAAHLSRRVPPAEAAQFPVNSVLPGHRNNPPDAENGIRALCAFNPIHYFELPELFMEFTASLTGKSPSTTGAGSEGALTKGPFNALLPVHDLNNALVSFILTDYPAFMTSAGYVGAKMRVDHDISLLVPEIWSRLSPEEREPEFMMKEGFLEKVDDFDHNGETILGSRLGYRITSRFVRIILGRIFNNPSSVIPREMLEPELQDKEAYVDSIRNIVEAQQRVAKNYFEDGSIDLACPPLKALLHIMKDGNYEGKTIDDPEIREQFTRESLIASDWYQKRLENQASFDLKHLKRVSDYLESKSTNSLSMGGIGKEQLEERQKIVNAEIEKVNGADYIKTLIGTLGCDFSEI
ncbi:hypothetical protein [Puniceicoccus vermicola]|uniref:hypothetical protein n=1 Tax=Puniceicoccus vermicola TaxID=388746 RepID=UPI001C8C06B4|nr:hypothetical protein [Puniceicoccus vermicola]